MPLVTKFNNPKFMRNYSLTVKGVRLLHTIDFPLTCDFNISRNINSSANTGHFTIYNLKPSVVRDLYKDLQDRSDQRTMTFAAGYNVYKDNLPTLFTGDVMRCFSYRQGPDIVTEIEAQDGGFGIIEGQVEQPFDKALWNQGNVKKNIQSLIATLDKYGIKPGVIGDVKIKTTRGITVVGSVWDILQGLAESGANTFIDLQKVYVLASGQKADPSRNISKTGADAFIAPGMLYEINSSTGLLGTPRRWEYHVDFNLLLEPNLILGQLINLSSDIQPEINAEYQVIGLCHTGTISGGVESGRGAVTAVKAYLSDTGFTKLVYQ